MPAIRRLAAVDAVARTRSFRLAAERLGTTQPTLSRQIAALEAELGTPLFRRGWSGAETTRAGEAAARQARAAMVALDEAEAQLHGGRPGPSLAATLRMQQLAAVDAVLDRLTQDYDTNWARYEARLAEAGMSRDRDVISLKALGPAKQWVPEGRGS